MSVQMENRRQRAFHHDHSGDVEAEYDRLRDMAHEEAAERNKCFQQSREAYENGDGAAAKELSNKGKRHAAKMDDYNRQASEFILRENNASGRIDDDEIDLHGQYVDEAERLVEERINADRNAGRARLCIIVGKGIHSNKNIPKVKPAVEQVLERMGLDYHTDEHNTGRIIVKLNDGGYVPPHQPHHPNQGQHHQKPSQHDQEPQSTDFFGSFFGFIQKQCCNIM